MSKKLKQLNIWQSLEGPAYHQTTDIPLKEVLEKEKKAQKQEDIVLAIFKEHKMLSASQAHKIYCKENKVIPIGSSRRAVSNLKKSGYLIRLDEMVQGLYDTEHLYQYIK